eukprot:CAMPEP_0194368280 /NCGR_PEP_ID=MMETSP0174-20130528/16531_1 /TAXON_ID=216777 /ORGANISM="Proboscia alata, Strain PI-D3" /LENGTH=201 /DNA_ID=CAMNT_0039144587 /DNA_START=42 /DNA_END=647 /DNA_ORIENTATION=-
MTPRSIMLLLSLVVATTAWSVPVPSKATTTTTTSTALFSSSDRRSFLSGTTAVATVILTSGPAPALAAAAAATPEAALKQWKDSVATIDNLYENWDTISKQGGDAIRKELGTANFGTTASPLFQIDKAFRVLRDSPDVDLVEFTEQSEEFANALVRADTMAYSSNFAGGSGKPTPPQVYIDKAKIEVADLQRLAKAVSALL